MNFTLFKNDTKQTCTSKDKIESHTLCGIVEFYHKSNIGTAFPVAQNDTLSRQSATLVMLHATAVHTKGPVTFFLIFKISIPDKGS